MTIPSDEMLQKYGIDVCVVDIDLAAGGGEYLNQDGFGWTNAIYLWMTNNQKK